MEINALQAVILGLVQGLTEFLPVSSSGHLVIVQHLLGIEAEMMSFDVFVHVGTLVAVLAAFRKDIWALLKKPFQRFTGMVVLACIPTALMGLLLDDVFEHLFSSLAAVACALIVTGILLQLSDRYDGNKKAEDMSVADALIIGTLQGFAITPGLSRSCTTLFGSLLRGLDRKEAARFSFILSIPVILGAALRELLKLDGGAISGTYLLGAVVAAVSGYFAITVFLRLLEKKSMKYFSLYVWVLAAVLLISSLVK